ncbi:MAG: hypothetical protein V4544_05405 [Pseudomonadota bacterium]
MNKIKNCVLLFIIVFLYASILTAESPRKGSPAATTPSPKNASTLIPTPASQGPSETFSLMLSDAEEKMISNAMNCNKNPIEEALVCHYLGGIVFSTTTNWTLWLNDQAYSYGSEIPGITILEVTNNKISLKASDSKSKSGSWLEMGKTFCCDTGQTLAGDQRR